MREFEPGQTRLSSRGRKRKQNRLLNILIGIVVVLICVVGYNIIFGGSEEANPASSAESNNSEGGNGTEQSISDGSEEARNENEAPSLQENDPSAGDDGETDATREDESSSTNTEDAADEPDAPEGPWEPIGTKQEGPHVSSYERGSVDWNEKVEALLYATGIPEDNYVLWRLENGGSPQQSIGKISTKDNQHKWYIVDLEWVDEKGWKPVNVEKVYKENLPN